jgi:hypothetical protein
MRRLPSAAPSTRATLTLALLLAMLAVLLPAVARSQAPAPTTPGAATLGERLNADGSLETTGGSAVLDATGYTMRLGPSGEPRFAPAAADDELWDDRFGAPGIVNGQIRALAADAEGQLYAAGWFQEDITGVPAKNIGRWDGQRWHAVGGGIPGVSAVRKLATHDATIYAMGGFSAIDGVPANQLARWDGSAWRPIGTGVGPQVISEYGIETPGRLEAIAVAPDGQLYVAGTFNRIDGTPANSVARWDGQRWHALGAGVIVMQGFHGDEPMVATVRALAVAENGTVIAGGSFNRAGATTASNIARWDGGGWSALGAGIGDSWWAASVATLAISGAEVYAGGVFSQAGGQPATNIARWDGQRWHALGAGLTGTSDSVNEPAVQALLVQDGTLVAGGRFTSADGQPIGGVARWDGLAWAAVGPSLESAFALVIESLAPAPDGFYVSGTFDIAGGREFYGVAQWSEGGWKQLGHGVSSGAARPAIVNAVAADGAGRVYVGGSITNVGGHPVRNLAMWDGARWHDVGGGVSGGTTGFVYALAVVGDELYVGGDFSEAGGVSARNIARWNIAARSWSTVGTGTDGAVNALAFGDGVLYVGGGFNTAGGVPAKDVAAWDGAVWSALGGEFEIFAILDSGSEASTYVNALVYDQGELFIGGHFQTLHQKGASQFDLGSYVPVHNLSYYNVTKGEWYTLGPEAHPGVTLNGLTTMFTLVEALAVIGDTLYVGGNFNRAGGIFAPSLAAYEIVDDRWWTPGAPGGVSAPAVRALANADGALVVGGDFTTIGGVAANSVASYDPGSETWSALGGGLAGNGGKVTALVTSGFGLFAGGDFSHAGGHPSLSFARWTGAIEGGSGPVIDPSQLTHRLYLPLVLR